MAKKTVKKKKEVIYAESPEVVPVKDKKKKEATMCVGCQPDCEGKGHPDWHYGGANRHCNKCACLEFKTKIDA